MIFNKIQLCNEIKITYVHVWLTESFFLLNDIIQNFIIHEGILLLTRNIIVKFEKLKRCTQRWIINGAAISSASTLASIRSAGVCEYWILPLTLRWDWSKARAGKGTVRGIEFAREASITECTLHSNLGGHVICFDIHADC